MKHIIIIVLLVPTLLMAKEEKYTKSNEPSPIPVEIQAGDKSSSYQLILSRKIVKGEKLNYFNLVSYKHNYDDNLPKNYLIQSIVSYNIMKNLSVGFGANLKSFSGVKPLISAFYENASKNHFLLIQPSYELDKDGLFELFTTFTWSPRNEKKVQPYFNIQALISFNENHAHSYHNWRLGAQYKIFRFGPAINIQYLGKNAISNTNIGGFINVLI